ncbi:DUF4062 domain-containing protein [Rubripirellula reticaptiva]|uniref:DUF4062 domain-containing protein n=1 Tax=Rubripirellula reticaptiva TaxID=2528013 RepID=A0A5C6ELR1_9BACT|nr:DUF4062 domain-containing protein [Rubripirellula reticaptiva]TWU49330.1 hypothetical protein Poly59_39440 [Rubripirellula reticaptiva]
MSDKPSVFISSTIYDFRDLRSALKFWLEELGFDVLLSEHNDFPVQADLNSYETCLQAIDACDYFIVLVGSRVGGWFDRDNRISITQAEYRRAYENLLAGRPKVIAFVRQCIWDIREDRSELETLLRNGALHSAELDQAEIGRITTHPSKFANDAQFTFNFLSEIARNEEMRTALAGTSPFPIGNWIRQFNNFGDIIDALRVEFRIGNSLRRISLIANLKAEIEANLFVMMTQHEGSANPIYDWASHARREFSGGIDDYSEIRGKCLKWLGIFAVSGAGIGQSVSTSALDAAVSSGEFLEFDQSLDAFAVGPLQQRLLDLKQSIERLRRNEELLPVAARIELMQKLKAFDGEGTHEMQNIGLVSVFSLHDSQSNVVALNKAVHRALSGAEDSLDEIDLYGNSPLAGESEAMQRERASREQVQQWLDN